jgi:hypothetical protein
MRPAARRGSLQSYRGLTAGFIDSADRASATQQGGGWIRARSVAPLITTGRPSSSRWSAVRQRVREWVARTTNSSSLGTAWIIAFPSYDAVTTHLPSALNDAVLTGSLCPSSSTASGAAPDRSQTRAYISLDAVTTSLPSALNDALTTSPVCPLSMVDVRGETDRSQTRAVLSADAVTTRVPSGLNDAL